MWLEVVAWICLAWYIFIALVCSIGYVQLVRHYSQAPTKSISSSAGAAKSPRVTVIRPCKGFDPYLYECLAATFHQDYPIERLTVHLCVSSRDDPAYLVLERIIKDFPSHDARVFVEEDDPALKDGSLSRFGPNPKIRNMSRSYREAKGDLVWIIDCNIWVNRGACGRMVDKLLGLSREGGSKPYKFVHHLPICVDVDNALHGEKAVNSPTTGHAMLPRIAPVALSTSRTSISAVAGGRLEELFLASSHAKFYTAINTVAVAPCIVGKSNMFRRSHLDQLTSNLNTETSTAENMGINHFSYNICEDHLIGDLLWRGKISNSLGIRNHGLVFGDLAIQPIAGMSVRAYIARRIRWLRVRKFTVTLATWVEPGTESFLCSAYGAFAVSTLPIFQQVGLSSAWTTFVWLWSLSVTIWALIDWTEYMLLHSGCTVKAVEDTPAFARPLNRTARRPFHQWLLAWLGREALALPIWIWAFWGGVTVVWRDRKFWVGMDMKVHEINDEQHKQNGHVGNSRKLRNE